MDYFKKYDENPYGELEWNIPERRQSTVAIVGGNAQNFRTPVKIAEWLSSNYPIETTRVALPDALKTKLPPLPNLVFLKSTESGSLAEASGMLATLESADFGLIIGDLSRNTVTAKAIGEVCKKTTVPTLVTRDAADLLVTEMSEATLMNNTLILFVSASQLQKLLKAVYYPRVLTMTQPLAQVVETLHKFTLSYPTSLVVLYNGQLLTAKDGKVVAVPLEKSGYSPITLWSGELAAKILAYNLFNPENFIKSTVCAIFQG